MAFFCLFFSPCQQSEHHLVGGDDSPCSVAILVQGRWATGQRSAEKGESRCGMWLRQPGQSSPKSPRSKPIPLQPARRHSWPGEGLARLWHSNSAALRATFLLNSPAPSSSVPQFPHAQSENSHHPPPHLLSALPLPEGTAWLRAAGAACWRQKSAGLAFTVLIVSLS